MIRNPYNSKLNLLIDDPELTITELLSYQKVGGQALINMTRLGIEPDPQGFRLSLGQREYIS